MSIQFTTWVMHSTQVPFVTVAKDKHELFSKVTSDGYKYSYCEKWVDVDPVLHLPGHEQTTLSTEVELLENCPALIDTIEDNVFIKFLSRLIFPGEYAPHVQGIITHAPKDPSYVLVVYRINSVKDPITLFLPAPYPSEEEEQDISFSTARLHWGVSDSSVQYRGYFLD